MVQSSDLLRISTVKSMDFVGQSSDLAVRIYLNPQVQIWGVHVLCLGVSVTVVDRGCLLHNLFSSDCPTEISAGGVQFEKLDLSWTQHRSDSDYSCMCQIIFFNFYSIHLNIIMKSSHFWGEILGFLCKSLDKSSDCMDFTKSMDLSWVDLSIFKFSPISIFNLFF